MIKKMIIMAILIIAMTGIAVAMPAEIDITPNDLIITPDGTSVKSYDVRVYDIDYGTYGTPQNRVITVETGNSNLMARIHGNGVDTGWTSTAKATSAAYSAVSGEYMFTLELKGTEAGPLSVYDNIGTVYDNTIGHDYAVASDSVAVPEFPTIALPIAAILGLAFIFQRRREEE